MDADQRAADLLVHYFRLVANAAGVPWDGDNDVEVSSIVDALVDAMRDEIRDHCDNSPHIYADGSTS